MLHWTRQPVRRMLRLEGRGAHAHLVCRRLDDGAALGRNAKPSRPARHSVIRVVGCGDALADLPDALALGAGRAISLRPAETLCTAAIGLDQVAARKRGILRRVLLR